MRHTLIEVDEQNKTGICSICGSVKLHPRNPKSPKPKGRWRCSIQKLEKRRFIKTGLTSDEYRELILNIKQCDICGKTIEENGKNLSMDHCHTTGIFRGMLCSSCNLALGLFRDNISVMERAISYLKKKEAQV